MKTDVVVIGAGVSGMSAALSLARHGRRVTLVERARRVGPLLRRFRRGSSWCDGGFHYTGGFLDGGALDVLFRYFGVREGLRPVAMSADVFDRLITVAGREVALPTGWEPVRAALHAAFPRSGPSIDAYVTEVRRIHDTTPFMRYDFDAREVMAIRKGVGPSLGEFLGRAGADEELAHMLGGYGNVLYGAAGDEIPIDFHAMVVGSLYESPFMLEGGGDAIVRALEAGLRREGVTLLCGRSARRIHLRDSRCTGVELDGDERIECTACIATMHPKLLDGMLDPGAAPALRGRVDRTMNSFGLFAVFCELDEVPAALRGSNLYRLYGRLDQVLAVLSCSPLEEGEKPSFVAFMTSQWAPADGEDYAAYKARETERVLAATLDTLPELRGRIRVIETASPRTYEELTGTVGGAVYGIRQIVSRRPLTALTGIDGFYLAGQSSLIAGVMGAMISGLVAAAQVIDIKIIWDEIQRCR